MELKDQSFATSAFLLFFHSPLDSTAISATPKMTTWGQYSIFVLLHLTAMQVSLVTKDCCFFQIENTL